MSLINNRNGVHFDSQFSPHVRLNIMRHKSSAPNRATLIRCKTTLGFLLTVLTFVKPLKGTFMSRGWLSPTSLMLHEDYSLIIIYHEIPMHGVFFILFLIFHMSNHSSYLCLGWIFYIIYYVSRLFLMNLGDSFGISIFVDESGRFAAKISASHFFWGSRCWNCNVLG